MKIHPSAIVEAGAQLGENVEVGPFSIISSEAVIGANCVIQSHVVVEGKVRMGAGNFIGHGTVIGSRPQDSSFKPATVSEVQIGEANVIREHCTIHRATAEGGATTLGDRNFLLVGSHVGHDASVANDVVMANDSLLGGFAQIGDGAFLGGGSMFHQHVRVGRLAMVQGRTVSSVPPFITAVANHAFGINVVGLRRAGFSAPERAEAKEAFRLFYRAGLNRSQALEKAETMQFGSLGEEFFQFVRASGTRGLVAYRAGKKSEE